MCQPPYANSPAPTASEEVRERDTAAAVAVPRRAAGSVAEQRKPSTMIAHDREHLHERKRRLHAAAELHAEVIDRRQHEDRRRSPPRAMPVSSSGTKNPA